MERQTPSKALGQIKKANRQPGDVHPKKPDLVWTEYKPGKFDWRKKGSKQSSSSPKKQKQSRAEKLVKLQKTLQGKDDDQLRSFAEKPQNNVDLRLMSYEILESRGVDVSDIDMDNGKLGTLNQQKKIFSPNKEADNILDGGVKAETGEDLDGEEFEWSNPDFIKKKFGGLKTKAQRIAADEFVHERKTAQENYITPTEEIFDLNSMYYSFLQNDSPLMIVSGGAGVGKSYNFHKIAEAAGKAPFDPLKHEPGDEDYDYIEAPEVKSEAQLAQVLKEHNGKTILFDDSDNVLNEKGALGMMKKATASSGKRMIGKKSTNKNSNVDPFEFDGKIVFLTNMTQHSLTKNPDIDAIFSRAFKKDINFTKKEQLSFISRLKDIAEFTGVERLEDPDEDKQERKEVFDLIKDNIDNIDPQKFNSRTLKESLEKKRSIDEANKALEDDGPNSKVFSDLLGGKRDWKKQVKNFLVKGGEYFSSSEEIKKSEKYFNL